MTIREKIEIIYPDNPDYYDRLVSYIKSHLSILIEDMLYSEVINQEELKRGWIVEFQGLKWIVQEVSPVGSRAKIMCLETMETTEISTKPELKIITKDMEQSDDNSDNT